MLQARERVEQMKEEKKKQIEQKFAQIDEKTEKVQASGCGQQLPRAVPWRDPGPSRWVARGLGLDPSGSYGFDALYPSRGRPWGPF